MLIAPVKNENNDVILFILNLEDITDAPVKTDVQQNTSRKLGMIYYSQVAYLFLLLALLSDVLSAAAEVIQSNARLHPVRRIGYTYTGGTGYTSTHSILILSGVEATQIC